jgi:hypothetical protein
MASMPNATRTGWDESGSAGCAAEVARMSWRKFTKDGENFGIPWDAKKFNFYKALKTIKKTVTHINCLILHLDETFLRARLLRNQAGHVC